MIREALLVLSDGEVFEGEAIGAEMPAATGEVVFNTVLTGYQEVITDPSYAGQIITFTTPHIGNYGVNLTDFESRRIFCRGVIVREMARRRSNWRATADLNDMLIAYGAFGTADEATLKAAALAEPGTDGVDLVAQVTTPQSYTLGVGGGLRVVAYDFGIKHTILRHLAEYAAVTVVPAHTSAIDVLAMKPDGVFLSNGPGDPAMSPYAVDAIREIVDAGMPTFGICLGHQLLSRALGGETFKLPFGHHGGNHPVQQVSSGKVEITSQNHNFCVAPDSIGSQADVTHINLNDNTNEGLRVRGANAFSVQYHPEAGPGPHDSVYLFDQFAGLMASTKGQSGFTRGQLTGYETVGLPTIERGVAG
jgi:carbamoyl-phosphate synthase small subunit